MLPLVAYVRRTDWPPHLELIERLRTALPDVELAVLADIAPQRLAEVRVAIVDGPTAEQLATMPALQLAHSTWAGVETVLPIVPAGVAVARMVDPQLADTMAEAVLAWTLYLHRDMPRYASQQRAATWVPRPLVRTSDRRVGIVGLGMLGTRAAERLVANGFTVAGWSRSPKAVSGVECFHGDDGLVALLERSDIIVDLLPQTSDTIGLLDGDAFTAMPAGASLINFGRGATVDDDALLAALDRRHLDHAVLDVFIVEPLPPEHRYWAHPHVTVLPHISGPTSPDTAAVIAAANVRRFLADGTLPADAIVDPSRGY
ncbi:MAG: 2-hydroxyacid dehydrogenase [Ilumatobacter sp.]|uniref:2-hydroxyacid dehydrogenase n=1 Tax=Ilumatobacter sp. TaxID=1967498 RepID=UPI00391A6A31